jgi:hypothetical protein
MREIHPDLAPFWLGGLLEVASVDGGPTDEQLRIIQALLRGYFGIDSALDLSPLPADSIGAVITDPGSRYRMVQTMIVLEFARHPASETLAGAIESYAAALGVDEPMLRVARRAAQHDHDLLMADWKRFARSTPTPPTLRDRPATEAAHRLAALRDCAPGSLGLAFADFYARLGPGVPRSGRARGPQPDLTRLLPRPVRLPTERSDRGGRAVGPDRQRHRRRGAFQRAHGVDGALRGRALRHPRHHADQRRARPSRRTRGAGRCHAARGFVHGGFRRPRPPGPGGRTPRCPPGRAGYPTPGGMSAPERRRGA